MTSLLSLGVDDLRRYQSDGKAFTALVDGVLRATAARCGISDAALATNLRVTIPDGGVDAQVDDPGRSDPSGRFGCSTIWQYKSARVTSLLGEKTLADLRAELSKAHVVDRIRAGYGYRLVIADSLTTEAQSRWSETLTAAARALNPDAPAAQVITADDLAPWISEFPALVIPRLVANPSFRTFELWQDSHTADTKQYVPVDAWQPTTRALVAHCDLGRLPSSAVFTLIGKAGVGKTRLVLEALASVPNAASTVIYTRDSRDALRLVLQAALRSRATVIVVADECPLETRWELDEVLADESRRRRIRVVAIEAAGASKANAVLEEMPSRVLTEILARNCGYVPADRRGRYAHLAEGYVRLAIYLCKDDPIGRGIRPGELRVADYLCQQICPQQQRALFALATVTRCGWRDDKAGELDGLCAIFDLGDPADVLETLRAMKPAPGFVAEAGRYLYVTPEVVAQWAFGAAWTRWFERSPRAQLASIPSSLLPAFLARVARSAEGEVRRVVDETFRGWAKALSPDALASLDVVDRLFALIENEPATFLRPLVELIEGTTVLASDTRRRLIVLAKQEAMRPGGFELAERLLRKLALHDADPRSAYGASWDWQELFSVDSSGAPVPFEARLSLLRRLLWSREPDLRRLAVTALGAALSFEGSLWSDSPGEWTPTSDAELRVELGRLLDTVAAFLDADLGDPAIEVQPLLEELITRVPSLYRRGFIDDLQRILAPDRLDDVLRAQLLFWLEQGLRQDDDDELHGALRRWLAEIVGEGVKGQLLRLVGTWGAPTPEDREQLEGLAAQLVAEPSLLDRHLGWLVSDAAVDPDLLGERLGAIDHDAVCLEMLLRATGETGRTGLARGYVRGRIKAEPSSDTGIREWLDRLELELPAVALDVACAGGARLDAVGRALRLVRAGKLPARVLTMSGFWWRKDNVDDDHAVEVVSVLAEACGDESSLCSPAVTLLWKWLHAVGSERLLARADFLGPAWVIVEARVEARGRDDDRWGRVVVMLAPHDLERAAMLAARGLRGDLAVQAEIILREIIPLAPRSVARAIEGALMAAPAHGVRGYEWLRNVLADLPPEYMLERIDEQGVDLARRLARYLPAPDLHGDDAAPRIPEVTALVLERFEDDQPTFEQFVASTREVQLSWEHEDARAWEHIARRARSFAGHRLRRVREWAEIEESRALEVAARQRERVAEELAMSGL